MISLLVCSRISGNENWSLFEYLDSLKQMSSNHENFEVLIKFDSDDENVHEVLPRLGTYPFRIKYIIEPRGRGYMDIHVFYNRLFSLVDERSIVVGAMSDDFVITQKGWDETILDKTKDFPDQIFIIHCIPHPPSTRPDYNEQKFYLDFDMNDMDILHTDECPFWSKKLLIICGGLGFTTFTDTWTTYIEHTLFHNYGIKRTAFIDGPIISRKMCDRIEQARWNTDRKYNHEFMRSNLYKTLVYQQALNLYLNISSNIKI